jgi:2-keto-4-pentenoate hydratase
MAFSVERAAEALLEARRRRIPLAIPAEGPADAAAAFAVQEKVAAALGPAAGWKVGRGTAAPFCSDHLRMSPARWPVSAFFRPAVEVEIAFRIARDLGRGGTVPSTEELREAIGSVHAAVEIADSRFDTWPVPDKLWALADHQSGGALVVDPDGVPWSGQPLDRARVSLVIDAENAFQGEGANPGGEPLDLLGQLASHCAARGGLSAGSYVTTGSLTGMIFVEPGAVVRAEIEGIGRVSLELTR